MKRKIIFTSLLIFSLVFIIVYAKVDNNKAREQKKTQASETVTQIGNKTIVPEVPNDKKYGHAMMPVDCKTCHDCEVPTKNNPCLKACPRKEFITIYHLPEEGPTVVSLDEVKGDYGAVAFSHKVHAQMSQMSGGCETCHHYNTTGPVLKCKTCHSTTRQRADISVPDLEAAFHRQCLNCHRQWSHSTDCQSCHVLKGQNIKQVEAEKLKKFKTYSHPPLTEPKKVIFKTNHQGGDYVTFFHTEHTDNFGIACKTCHSNDNCINCHDVTLKAIDQNTPVRKTHKSFQEHHDPCSKCHVQQIENNCSFCHQDQPAEAFNHLKVTGFNLAPFHTNLMCNQCHKQPGNFKNMDKNCTSCHNNFVKGKFDHKRVGIELNETHSDLDCSDCHKNNRFDKSPDCSDCHDGYAYPKQIPGKKAKR